MAGNLLYLFGEIQKVSAYDGKKAKTVLQTVFS